MGSQMDHCGIQLYLRIKSLTTLFSRPSIITIGICSELLPTFRRLEGEFRKDLILLAASRFKMDLIESQGHGIHLKSEFSELR
ncbi:MAG: hypothetical protein JWM11_7168 [Planctomycetaceae bacterium]|nr:hypothetical protein [Planctomycetaceae bacterium]